MVFQPNYPNMGKTERIRLPSNSIEHVENVFKEYNRLYKLKGEEGLIKIQKKLEKALQDID